MTQITQQVLEKVVVQPGKPPMRVMVAYGTGALSVLDDASAAADRTWSAQKLIAQFAAKANAAHTHAIADVTGLQAALDGKLAAAGGTVTGNLTVNGTFTMGGTTLWSTFGRLFVDANAANYRAVKHKFQPADGSTTWLQAGSDGVIIDGGGAYNQPSLKISNNGSGYSGIQVSQQGQGRTRTVGSVTDYQAFTDSWYNGTALFLVNGTQFYDTGAAHYHFQAGMGGTLPVFQLKNVVNGATGDFLRAVDSADAIKFRLKADGAAEFASVQVNDVAYGAGWAGSLLAPTRNAVYNKIAALEATVNGKIDSSLIGVPNGLLLTDATNKIPASYLPSYVDDVLEYANSAAFPAVGEAGKIYISLNDSHMWRWSGSAYFDMTAAASGGTTATSTDSLAEGATNLYFTVGRVRATALTAIDVATTGAVSATDTVLSAIGKLEATKLSKAGGTMTGLFTSKASAAGGAGVNHPHGADPTAPNNGDFWSTTAGFKARVNGVTVTFSVNGHTHAWADIVSGKPTTLTGYGITNGAALDATENVFSGIGNFITPNAGTTGGLRLRANATLGYAIQQMLSSDGATQWGYWRYNATGDADWYGTGGLKWNGNKVALNNPQLPANQATPATLTPDFAYDQINVTALANAMNVANPTGTAVDGWGMALRIKDNGTSRAITWGSQYRGIGGALTAATTAGKTMYFPMIWNAADSKFDVFPPQIEP
ncbi:hypothetical protein [Sphingomonas jaspsi]|uniref:hypothetical protein n=1 Tax=Sphingomonas jaspsi TaxID=392409 RepID=UPI0004B03D59|nr:hypothetical protein [Sphingomonas jaspsi]